MNRLGLYNIWIKWIKGCIQTVIVSVFVNGSSTDEFSGDPIAQFLFVITVEGIAGLMRQAVKNNIFLGIKVGNENADISFRICKRNNFLCRELGVECYSHKEYTYLASGLKINFYKSTLVGVHVKQSLLQGYAQLLNYILMSIRDGSSKGKYLASNYSKDEQKVAYMKVVIFAIVFLSFFRIPHFMVKKIKKNSKEFLVGRRGRRKEDNLG
ncbi:hypothetical protein CR513_12862, partial [Mucuna pruriens]